MDRQVIEYYPEWLREFREIKALSKLQQTQSEKLWNCLQSIIDNNFLETLDEYGCSKWEKALELQVKEGMTIEERRANGTIPPGWYVVEQANIDGIVIWQSADGLIYQTGPGSSYINTHNSLVDYFLSFNL